MTGEDRSPAMDQHDIAHYGDSTGGHAPADRWQVRYIGSVVATAATRAAAKTRMHELEDANPHMRGRLTIRDSRRQQ